jgi:hypothetical protein
MSISYSLPSSEEIRALGFKGSEELIDRVAQREHVEGINPAHILRAAADLIEGDRAKDYGDFRELHQRVGRREGRAGSAVARTMKAVKEERLSVNPVHLDSMIDAVAYYTFALVMDADEAEAAQ